MSTIAVVDYGMGNLRSVAKALERVAPQDTIVVTHRPEQVIAADRVVFPGVGAMPDCIHELESRGLRDAVLEAARTRPFLGICLGMQALFGFSEEGNVHGLGLLPGSVRRFPRDRMVSASGERLKVPQIGWNEVHQDIAHPLWKGITSGTRFYFVHSYYVDAEDARVVAAHTDYPFAYASACASGNLFAVQFHPEKSQTAGLALLANFAGWDGTP